MIKNMKENVIENSSENWARGFLESLVNVNVDPGSQIATDCISTEDRHKLDRAGNVAFFLDYDGTLREFENNPDAASPTREISDIINHITSKKGREVYIISGRCKDDLEKWFSGFNCTLIAEHGFFFKHARNGKWQSSKKHVDLSWKKEIHKILKHYALSTPGSFVEDKTASIVWHFRSSDPELGERKARLLVDELSGMTANMPIIVQHGRKIVEVCSQHINKGESLKYALSLVSCDVVVCAGDDLTDEHMFQVGNSKVISIKIGKGETSAKYRFTTPSKFRNLLRELAGING
jgi:trehalose 6-phosphate synthase/phosphatase